MSVEQICEAIQTLTLEESREVGRAAMGRCAQVLFFDMSEEEREADLAGSGLSHLRGRIFTNKEDAIAAARHGNALRHQAAMN